MLPDGIHLVPGDYVRVPLGKKETVGVLWSFETDPALMLSQLRGIRHHYDLPPMCDAHRRFMDWVARYTMSDLGSVLKLSLSVPDVFDPPKEGQAYKIGVKPAKKVSEAREKVLRFLQDGAPRRKVDILKHTGVSASAITAMVNDKQLVEIAVSSSPPCQKTDLTYTSLTLSPEQASAAQSLQTLVQKKTYAVALLDGVTGAGKTEVYFEAVADALKQDKQVLILLPEISLSTQFLERFEKRFGTTPALWHSEVTPAKRRIAWKGVAEGKTRVVVGARSALFLPYIDLGLIVVDEEHDTSYKQEEGILYNARDMAIVRGKLGDIPVVLVSATPSLESMNNARQGKYQYLHLPARHAGAKLPDIHVVNLKANPPERAKFIAPPLVEALQKTFAAGEQSLLFLNRRGYAPLTLCRTCGYRFQCPSCSAWLVEHRRVHRLQCHHCGYSAKTPSACPSCNNTDSLAACGPGVERIQEEIQAILPEARALVLASDITDSAKSIKSAINAIESHKIDVIIGTQIIAKGHHFPSLTLVGVVDADLGLSGGDLRAGERTFQLLHQVAGRAGRGEKPGHVYIQTYMPEQSVIRALAANDRDAFLAAESREREKAEMPPFGKLAALILSGPDESGLDFLCRSFAQSAPRYDDIRILGPAPAPMAFLRGKYRRRFLIKTGKNIQIQKFLEEWLSRVKIPASIGLKIDIDPQSFF